MAAHDRIRRIKRMREQGFSLRAIADEIGDTTAYVLEVLRQPDPPRKRPPSALRFETQQYEREREAVRELRAEGCDEAVIRANFPNVE